MRKTIRLPKEVSDGFIDMVNAVLKKTGITQTNLGDVAGYSKQSISRILRGKHESISKAQFMSIYFALISLVRIGDLDIDRIMEIDRYDFEPYSKWIIANFETQKESQRKHAF